MKQLQRLALVALAIAMTALTGASNASATASNLSGHSSSPYSGTTVGGPVSTLSFSKCTEGPVVVDAAGTLSIERIGTTTNGTVRSNGAKVTVPSPFGALTCTTSNTDIGTLTGVASGTATMDITAVLNCGFFLPSAKWEGTYIVKSPEGLGVTSVPVTSTLEVGGVPKVESVAIKASVNGSSLLSATGGSFANTCLGSAVEGSTEAPFSGTTVGGEISVLSFSSCTTEKVVVDEAGSLTVEHIAGTTNGTVRSNGAKVTVPSPFGALTCTTSNTDIGTLTGVASGTATMDITAVLNCGFFLPSAKWEGTYTVTGPEGLGVTS